MGGIQQADFSGWTLMGRFLWMDSNGQILVGGIISVGGF